MLEPNMFASGGYDHIVHLWTLYEDTTPPSAEKLEIKHQSIVHTLLAIRDTSRKLVSGGADRTVNIYDISSARVSILPSFDQGV
jgi:WD40 repeat protein